MFTISFWFSMAVHSALSTEEKAALITSHDQAFEVFDEKIRDPFIMRGPDEFYYLTGTTTAFHWGEQPGIKLYRSQNLIEWEDLGVVWDLYRDGEPNQSWHFNREGNPKAKHPYAIWAPEVHYLNETWWLTHSRGGGGHGLLKSTSGKATGPYEVLPPAGNTGIDSHLFQEDGTTYYLWGFDNIAPLKEDFSAFATAPQKIAPPGKHPLGYEGILLNKINDKYLLMASGRYGYEPSDTYDLYYTVSKNLMGPYSPRRMAIKNAGHGNLFQDRNGQWWSTAFDHEFITSKNKWTVWLVPIEIKDTGDDLVIEVKDPRFRPTAEDQQVVTELRETGVPKDRKGLSPWDRKEDKVKVQTAP